MRACVFACVLQYFMPYIRDPDGVKRRRAVTVMDNLLERYVDMEAQKEEKLREVRRRTPFPSQRPASPSLANALVPFPSQRHTSRSLANALHLLAIADFADHRMPQHRNRRRTSS